MVIDLAIKTKGIKMNNIKLLIYGLAIASIIFLLAGCAGQPAFCPEVSFKLCPTK
jgi:hypothetical protein